MRVLFFYQHFWPDSPPYANMLRSIGSHLCAEGHRVSMLTGAPSYKETDRENDVEARETIEGIKVRRLRQLPGSHAVQALRHLSKAVWPVRALLVVLWDALCGRRHDVIVAATIPPVINGLCGLIAARLTGAAFVYHLQDVYPEIGCAGGLWSENSFRHKVLYRVDSFTCGHAEKCIVLSQDMADALGRRGVQASKIHIINNFMLVMFPDSSEDTQAFDNKLPDTQGRFRVIFAGNLGRFQGLDDLLTAFLAVSAEKDELELHFLGEGAAMEGLVALADSHKRVFFHGHQPFEQACVLMSSCDAGIVSIRPDIYKYAYPSKTLTYLGLGLPVFALLEQESSLAKDVAALELGVSAANNSPEELREGFSHLVQFLSSEANDRERIKQVADSLNSKNIAMTHWVNLVEELAHSQTLKKAI